MQYVWKYESVRNSSLLEELRSKGTSAVQLIPFKCWGHVPNSLLWDAMFREYSSPHPSPFSALTIWSMLNSGSRIPTSLSCWPLSTGRICPLPPNCVGATSGSYRKQFEVCLWTKKLLAKRKDNLNTIVPALLGIEPNIN